MADDTNFKDDTIVTQSRTPKVDPEVGMLADAPTVASRTLLTEEEERAAIDAAKDFKPIGKNMLLARRFFRNRSATIGLIILVLVAIVANVGKYVSPYKVSDLDFSNISTGPSADHWLGTNQAGADVATLLCHGTSLSLLIGTAVGVMTPILAVMYGCTMAYFGGWVDKVMLFFLETLIMAPQFLLIAIVMSGRSGGPTLLVILLVAFGWMGTARLVRGMSLAFVDREYVKAAKYMGVPSVRIIWRHLVPNIASLTILNVTMGIWGAILSEVAFSFIGVGIKLPNTSLGLMIQGSSDAVSSYPWLFWAPLITLTLITGPLALINDGLRDAFDPNSNSTGAA